jgi:hypothetical protein
MRRKIVLLSVLLKDQTPDVRERVCAKVTEAYRGFAVANGRVRTTSEAIGRSQGTSTRWPETVKWVISSREPAFAL